MYDVMPMECVFNVSLMKTVTCAKQMFFPVSAARYKFISTVKRAKFWVADDNKIII